ncbi:MAG: MFS transporter [Euryarchaeota archaeon]|nr:MFS transporter [Euryarchaeota archaeon]
MKAESVQMLSSASLFASAFLVPLILKDALNVDEAGIGLVIAAYSTAFLLSSWLFGRLADVRGRKRVLQAGLLACTIVSALQFFATSVELLVAARIAMGFAAGTFPSALMAYAYESKGRVGRYASFGALGWGVGTLLAGFFAVYSLFAPFLVSAVLFGIAFGVSLALPFPKQTLLKVPRIPIAVIKRNAASYVAVLLRHTGANMVWVIYPIFLATINPDPMWIGIVYAVNAGTQFALMPLLDRFDGKKLLAVGLALSALAFIVFAVSDSEWMVIGGQVILGSSWSCAYVGSLKSILEKGSERSTSSGLLDSTLNLSAIIGSMIGGFVALSFGDCATMYVAAVMSLVALGVFLTMLNGKASA